MIKSELIKTIAKKMTHLSEQRVEEAVNLIINCMSNALQNSQRIEIRGFGAWTVQAMPARKAFNPKTGEKTEVPSKNKVHFKTGLKLKQRLIESQGRVAIEEN